jgi:hypothetical protein
MAPGVYRIRWLTADDDDGIVVSRSRKDENAMGASALPAEWRVDILDIASDRFERRLAVELSELQLQLCTTMHRDLTDIRRELATTRVEILKWSFAFWIGQVAVIAGLLAFMLRAR